MQPNADRANANTLADWITQALAHARERAAVQQLIDRETEAVVLSLALSLEARDANTEGHCERLSAYAVRLGAALGLTGDELRALEIAGVVHDVGKVAVPDCILLKPGALDDEERRIMQQHPITGENICRPMRSFEGVLPIVRHHHERMDGSGYPDGLRGEEIPLGARILQTVDIFDALTMDRPYRHALPTWQAFRVMREEAERGWLDARLVEQFENVVEQVETQYHFVHFRERCRERVAKAPVLFFPAPATA